MYGYTITNADSITVYNMNLNCHNEIPIQIMHLMGWFKRYVLRRRLKQFTESAFRIEISSWYMCTVKFYKCLEIKKFLKSPRSKGARNLFWYVINETSLHSHYAKLHISHITLLIDCQVPTNQNYTIGLQSVILRLIKTTIFVNLYWMRVYL